MNSDGFNYTVGIYNRVKAQLSAFAKAGKVNIISSPHVLASDNKEAKIDISDEIPVASSSYEYTSGESPVVSTNIEYRDTGAILSVTPHINEFGLVTMDIEQEVSEYSGDIEVAGKKYPSFFKRRINTSLAVKHGQTIVLGGLIKGKNSLKSQGTPWLVNIPIIRYLFGKESDEDNKSELIVLLSPRVIISLDDVEAVTKEFKSKVQNVVKILK
jgi:general secretion pathway protein D